jgi:hypothetical protein
VRSADLLHDTSLALREGDVATRLVLDELDLDLATLTATLLIVLIVILTSHGGSWALGTTGVAAGTGEVVTRRRLVKAGGGVSDVGHGGSGLDKDFCKGH